MTDAKFTMQDALNIQADHLKQWEAVLSPEAYKRLLAEATRLNADGYKTPSNVFRGYQIDNFMGNLMRDMAKEQEANYLNSFMSIVGDGKFARKCDVTGKGMNCGYCIDEGGMYIASPVDMLKHLEEHTVYTSIEEAFEDDYCYWTEWTELDEEGYYLADGTHVSTEAVEVDQEAVDKAEQDSIDRFEDDRQSNW
jgi:hypothetical protein